MKIEPIDTTQFFEATEPAEATTSTQLIAETKFYEQTEPNEANDPMKTTTSHDTTTILETNIIDEVNEDDIQSIPEFAKIYQSIENPYFSETTESIVTTKSEETDKNGIIKSEFLGTTEFNVNSELTITSFYETEVFETTESIQVAEPHFKTESDDLKTTSGFPADTVSSKIVEPDLNPFSVNDVDISEASAGSAPLALPLVLVDDYTDDDTNIEAEPEFTTAEPEISASNRSVISTVTSLNVITSTTPAYAITADVEEVTTASAETTSASTPEPTTTSATTTTRKPYCRTPYCEYISGLGISESKGCLDLENIQCRRKGEQENKVINYQFCHEIIIVFVWSFICKC